MNPTSSIDFMTKAFIASPAACRVADAVAGGQPKHNPSQGSDPIRRTAYIQSVGPRSMLPPHAGGADARSAAATIHTAVIAAAEIKHHVQYACSTNASTAV